MVRRTRRSSGSRPRRPGAWRIPASRRSETTLNQPLEAGTSLPTSLLRGAPFIFVGGPPRSGTTLLQNMLDSHPEIYGGPEFHHLPDIVDLWRKVKRSVARRRIQPFTDPDHLREAIRHLVLAFLEPPLANSGAKRLSEKTPGNALVLAELLELFPEAKGVMVVRDPRAIVSSLLGVGRRYVKNGERGPLFTRNLTSAIRHTREHLESGLDAAKTFPGRIEIVRYEDLVAQPEHVTQRVCDFLGMAFADSMLEPGNIRHPGEADIANRLWYTTEEFRRNPDPSRMEAWKESLSPSHQVLVSAAFRRVTRLTGLGYDLGLQHLTFGQRLRGRTGAIARRMAQPAQVLARKATRALTPR